MSGTTSCEPVTSRVCDRMKSQVSKELVSGMGEGSELEKLLKEGSNIKTDQCNARFNK